MGSRNLISFAVKQGWYDPSSGKPFVVSEVYERDRDTLGVGVARNYPARPGHQMRSDSVLRAEKWLRERAPRIGVRDVTELLRGRPYSNRKSKYAQVAELRSGVPAELGVVWIALGPPESGVYVPFHLGIDEVPIEYGRHRYLTRGEVDPTHLRRERQGPETTRYAYRAFDRLFMLVDEHRDEFYPALIEALRAREAGLLERQRRAEAIATTLIGARRNDLARAYLTEFCATEAREALRLADTLADAIEARTRLIHGIRAAPAQ
jgi:hypothetical protein